jgi:hypothetical protein
MAWNFFEYVAKMEPQLRIANCVIYTARRRAYSPIE